MGTILKNGINYSGSSGGGGVSSSSAFEAQYKVTIQYTK